MATLNTIDGTITSGGSNPPLNTKFPCTLYRIEFSTTEGSIEYINHNGVTRNFSFNNNFALTDRISQIISIKNVKLVDLGLVFTIPATSPAPTFKAVERNKTYNVKSFKVYFGNPISPAGSISYHDEAGVTKRLDMLGTTATIKATRFVSLSNVRIVDLNPEIADFPVAAPPPLSLVVGSYNTLLSPVNNSSLILVQAPVIPLASGGSNPQLNRLFSSTLYDFDFPEVGTGTIEYLDQNNKVKKYTLNKFQVMSFNGLLSDSVIMFMKIDNVKIIEKGLVYQIVEPTPAPKYIVPTSMPIIPTKPKFYQVYFGHPLHPQGSITYFDSKGANKSITNFGKVVTIDASNIYALSNVRLVEVGDVI